MIRFSRKEDYAIILIHALTREYNKRFLPLSEVAKQNKISLFFLRNLAQDLRKANIINAIEGKKGGYFLSKSPDEIYMKDVFSALHVQPMMLCCDIGDKKGNCEKMAYCEVGHVWRKLNEEFLGKISAMSIGQFTKYSH